MTKMQQVRDNRASEICRCSPVIMLLMIAADLLVVPLCHGWTSPSSMSRLVTSSRSFVLQAASLQEQPKQDQQPSKQQGGDEYVSSIRADIDELRKEANARLEALTQKMDALQQHQQEEQQRQQQHQEKTAAVVAKPFEDAVTDTTTTTATETKEAGDVVASQTIGSGVVTSTPKTSPSTGVVSMEGATRSPSSLVLLDGTRWRMAFNIGREPGTWMPAEWGASGDRLLLQVTVDLTPRHAHLESDNDIESKKNEAGFSYKDEFFQGIAGTKILEVVDAYVVPRGIGGAGGSDQFVGRRPLSVKPRGAYKVVRGQGPMGTDIVRLFVELDNDVINPNNPNSDVVCPSGRVYATCGYFDADQLYQPPVVTESATSISSSLGNPTTWKDVLSRDYNRLVTKYEQIKHAMDTDPRLFSLDQVKRFRECIELKRAMQKLATELQEAKQKQPDRSQLRFTEDERVALTKDGCLCRKVHKGLAMEYHILGRMELANIAVRNEDEDDNHNDDLSRLSP